MDKMQKCKKVTEKFLTFVGKKFPNYRLDDDGVDGYDGFGGYITIQPKDNKNKLKDNKIVYHRLYFDIIFSNNASKQIKEDAEKMSNKLSKIIKELKLS
jgi:hypothetical protein